MSISKPAARRLALVTQKTKPAAVATLGLLQTSTQSTPHSMHQTPKRDAAIEAQMDADRGFFAANHQRRFHLRTAFPGEIALHAPDGVPDDLARSVMIVAQIFPGMRCVRPILIERLNGRVALLDNDPALSVLWRVMCQGHSTTSDEAEISDIFARCEATQ